MKRLLAALSVVVLIGLSSCDDGSGPSTSATPSSTPAEVPTTSEPPESPSASPPAREESYSFAVIGDFGAGTLDQLNVAARMCEWRESHPYDLVFTTGDNIYPDGSPEMFEPNFFAPYECLFDDGVQWHASLGNHDWMTDEGQPELDEPAFGMEGTDYVVRESGIRFVIANSNELDRAWLARNVRARAGDRWTVVLFHHPVHSPGLHGSTETLADLPAMFERAGVDLVLNGHDHLYAVTKPLDGIRYVVTGGGGAQLYPCLLTEESEVCRLEHHFLYVTATEKKMTVTAVPDAGEPFHEFKTRGID